jgi:tRNA(Ile2) C34 agmatinyltransferase TiaS
MARDKRENTSYFSVKESAISMRRDERNAICPHCGGDLEVNFSGMFFCENCDYGDE